jgi:Domain of unknown function (DUF4412)
MRKLSLAGALACSLLAGPALNAQMGMQQPAIRGVFHPTVGAGADYDLTKSDGTKMPIEMSIVGKESVQGSDGYWMEMTMQDQRMGQVVTKMLLVVDGANSHVDKMVILIPGRGAMSMPMSMMQGRGPQQPQDIRNSGTMVGKESVTVPAGSFNCDHWKSSDGTSDVWVTEEVSPYGLVKMTDTKNNVSMVLTKTLTAVQDKITGPVMDMSQMMRGMGAPPQQ